MKNEEMTKNSVEEKEEEDEEDKRKMKTRIEREGSEE